MDDQYIAWGILGTALTVALSCTPSQQTINRGLEKPNVILIHLDDMGYGDLSLTGATGYSTPHIDNMAREGIFLTNYYSPQAVSSASRAGLLTGCYPNRVGFFGALGPHSKIGISSEEETIAELLQAEGYATAAYGKWHLGVQQSFLPTNHGFDEFYGIPYSNDMWPRHPTGSYPDLPLFEDGKIVNPAVTPDDQSQFTTDFTLRTVEFIKRNRETPSLSTWHIPCLMYRYMSLINSRGNRCKAPMAT